MKFAKFAKSTAPDGAIYTMNDEPWLTDGTVWMKVPMRYSVAGNVRGEMPSKIAEIIQNPYHAEAFLSRAELPEADSKIKDAVRYYSCKYIGEIGISNDAWGLIDGKDRTEVGYLPGDDHKITALLLLNADGNPEGAIINIGGD